MEHGRYQTNFINVMRKSGEQVNYAFGFFRFPFKIKLKNMKSQWLDNILSASGRNHQMMI